MNVTCFSGSYLPMDRVPGKSKLTVTTEKQWRSKVLFQEIHVYCDPTKTCSIHRFVIVCAWFHFVENLPWQCCSYKNDCELHFGYLDESYKTTSQILEKEWTISLKVYKWHNITVFIAFDRSFYL